MPTHENDPRQTTGNPQMTASQRFASRDSGINTPLSCECGSTYFYTVYAEEFASGGYGTVEFRSISTSPHTIRVCLCGRPLISSQGGSSGGSQGVQSARQRFAVSAKAAKEAIDAASAQKILDKVGSREEVLRLMSRTASLEAQVGELLAARVVASSTPTAEEPVKKLASKPKKAKQEETV